MSTIDRFFISKVKRYIILLLIGFIIGISVVSFVKKDIKKEVVVTSSVKIKENKVLVKDKPIIKYVNVVVLKKEKIESDIKPYKYNFDSTYVFKNGYSKLSINGYGTIDDIKIENNFKDSIVVKSVIVNNTVEKTILKRSNGVFLSGEYIKSINKNNVLKPIYKVDADLILGKIIIGSGIGVQGKEVVGSVKLGFKL